MDLFDKSKRNWPPSFNEIDLSDGNWITPQQASGVARVSLRTIQRWQTERDFWIKVGGRVWINKDRMFGL